VPNSGYDESAASHRCGGPLDGMLVIDAASIIAGPLAGALFRMFGARVIKVELPGVGDAARTMGPPGAETSFWSFLSQDKECVSLKLSDPRGAAMLRRMAAKADVLIESFRPGTLERWGVGPDELHSVNSALTIVRISGFGQEGPYKNRPGYGTLAEAMAGFAHVTGESDGPPTLPGFPVADSVTGLIAAIAAMATLLGKARGSDASPRGRIIDVNLFEALTYFLSPLLLEAQMLGVPPERRGNRAFGAAPRNAGRCSDGKWVAYSIQSPPLLSKLIGFLGLQEDPRFADPHLLRSHGEELDKLLLAWIAARPRPVVLDELIGADLPVAPVNDSGDILEDEHLRARGDLIRITDELRGVFTLLAPPARLDGWRREPRQTGFSVGRHNDVVYGEWLGMPSDELAVLRDGGVI
jgi:crotonobetainyl-CoA:carnitine CoA-transferase CaiB-like acyl-CoA transferase